jgi:hypothetical protein
VASALGIWQRGRCGRFQPLPLGELGLVDWNTFAVESTRWRAALMDPSASTSLSTRDWTSLLLTELAFASSHLGAAGQFFTTPHRSDGLAILRSVQAVLSRRVAIVVLMRKWFVHKAIHVQCFSCAERVQLRGADVGQQQHVRLMDRLEPAAITSVGIVGLGVRGLLSCRRAKCTREPKIGSGSKTTAACPERSRPTHRPRRRWRWGSADGWSWGFG